MRIGTMAEFKYGSSNYNKKLSTTDRTEALTAVNNSNMTSTVNKPSSMDDNQRRPHPRLKKSFSECEYYENVNCPATSSGLEVNFNLSPSHRQYKETAGDLHHHRFKQTSINDIAFIEGGSSGVGGVGVFTTNSGKLQYNYDTLKSQYLLQQQQKLKEYKNDPNYLTNGDNYSSESSTETRGILKNGTKCTPATTTDTYSRNSLKRNKGLSTLSLCSCDAETEVIPSQSRPLYQYSLDRKRPLHTYTCEQNAQILLRLEKERQKKYGSSGRLSQHISGPSNTDIHQKPKPNNGSLTVDFSANSRMSGHPETNHVENEVFIGDVNRVTKPNIGNNNIDDDDIIPPNFPPPPIKSMLRRNSSITKHQQTSNAPANQAINQNPSMDFTRPNLLLNKPDLFNFASSPISPGSEGVKGCPPMIDDNMKHQQSMPLTKTPLHSDMSSANGNSCQSKLAYPLIFCDDHQLYDKENSFYLYHHEPASYLPNYDNISSKYPDKYNTMDCAGQMFPLDHFNIPISKLHASTCNLNNQFNSSNLINGHHFSNSLSNFNMMDPHQQIQNYYNFNPSFTQLPEAMRRSENVGGVPGAFGSSSIMGSSFASNISLNGTPKQQQANMPWKHRNCSSRSSSSGTNSSKWDLPSRQWLALTSILLIAGAASVAVPLALSVTSGSPFEERFQAALHFLEVVPLIDGHNDLPWNIRKFMHNQINDFRFDEDLKTVPPWANSSWSQTDLQRLKRGRITAQFWAAYVPCEAQYKDAVQITLEQIDVIERLTDRYSPQMTKCASVYDINQAHKNRQICSLIGVEGGHSLGGSLGVLRTFYSLGVRYMTLTSTCHTPWADSSNADAPKYDVKHGGLTAYGKIIVREMNRLGMAVDLSKSSVKTMRDVLAITEAPIIFSHSSAFGLCNSSRNVHDEILKIVTKNGGLVMVNFYNKFLSCNENATVHNAVAHINHIKNIAGIDHVGLGAGFDGINYTPRGIEDVSGYPYLFAELMGHGWTAEELTKLAGGNVLRVFSEVERVRDMKRMNNEKPFEDIPNFRLPLQTSDEQLYNCSNPV